MLVIGALAVALAVINPITIHAVPVTPDYDTFGPLAGATFGGSGIPNHSVAVSTSGGVTLGLEAHQRYVGPDLVDNGAGTYWANPGPGTPANLSTWNFAFYGLGSASAPGATARLFYDFDPAIGNDQSTLGYVNLGLLGLTPGQDSWNLGFSFLDTAIPGVVVPPTYPSFNPNAVGEYSFVLEAYNRDGQTIGRSAINVNTSAVPDSGSTFASLGLASLGLLAFRKFTLVTA